MSNQYYFFGTRTTFIQATPKIFRRVNGALMTWHKNDSFFEKIAELQNVQAYISKEVSALAAEKLRGFVWEEPLLEGAAVHKLPLFLPSHGSPVFHTDPCKKLLYPSQSSL